MKSFVRNLVALLAVLAFSSGAFASVEPEMEGMEAVSRGDGTFLIGAPTYYFDRVHGAGGIHSESEIWNAGKLRYRLLMNRLSVLPSWDPIAPSVWAKTGNELGDMIYQDLITSTDRPDNRTPILDAGFRTPSFGGFWVTGRLFQDDHYSERLLSHHKKYAKDNFAIFGENRPMFSSAYAGVGYGDDFVKASIFAGEEYMWLYSESSRWIPVHYLPRVESRVDVGDISITLDYESIDYQNPVAKEKGNRLEISGSFLYENRDMAPALDFTLFAGVAFRALDDSGHVYTALDENRVVWPFAGVGIRPLKRLSVGALFGVNDEDWLVQDSIEYAAPAPERMGVIVGFKNISGSRLNPLADDEEYFGSETISLEAEGQMNLVQSYMKFSDSTDYVGFGGGASVWAEHGAETFDTLSTVKKDNLIYRYGDVSRINSWIKGITGEIWIAAWYRKMFEFKALGGFERIDGPTGRFEVTPAEFFTSFSADWFFRNSLRISHALRYRSDAEWNLRGRETLVVKGDWYWDATFEQQFPKHGIYLTGTLIHVLADEVVQVPNAAEDRIRFVCSLKKMF